MAPADTPRRKNRESNYLNIGVQGRKTGITVKDTGLRDEHGLEVIEGIFSSPEKSPPKRAGFAHNTTITSEEDMELVESTLPEPAESLIQQRLAHTGKTLLPPPRSRSPMKTSLNSPARRQSSMGPISSPIRQHLNGSLTRAASHPVANRRLDFSMNEARPSVENTPSGSVKRSVNKIRQTKVDSSPVHTYGSGGKRLSGISDLRLQPSPARGKKRGLVLSKRLEESEDDEEEDEEEEEDRLDGFPDEVNGYAEDPIIEQSGEGSLDLGQNGVDQNIEDSHEDIDPQPKRKARGRPKKDVTAKKTEDQAAISAPTALKRGRGRGKNANVFDMQSQEEEAEEEVVGRRPGKRQRTMPSEPPKSASKTKKSKPPPAQRDPRARITSAKKKLEKAPATIETSPERREIKKTKKADQSNSRAANLKGRSAQRRGTPMDDDGARVTRSGRSSFKPLAFWRNEHAVYGRDDSASLLPVIKEIVRTEEVEQPFQKARPRRPIKKTPRRPEIEEFDEEDLEPWEVQDGVIMGPVKQWVDETLQGTQDERAEEEEEYQLNEIAYSSMSIETREVANTTFRYQKLLTHPFFGSGMVDLPPRGVKKQKNSRKMQMVFFVFYGRVQVTVGDTVFRISQGGVWQVPRGNLYSITNDYEQPARIFFAQGCEVPPEAPQVPSDSQPEFLGTQ